MPIDVAEILAAEEPASVGGAAVIEGLGARLLALLAAAPGRAFTRAEIGDALKDAGAARLGVTFDRGFREVALALTAALAPPLAAAIQASSEAIDVALGELVRGGRVGFAVHGMQARFWALEGAEGGADGAAAGPGGASGAGG